MGNLVLISATTFAVVVVICSGQHFSIMLFGAAITWLQSVYVENLMVFLVLGKKVPHKLDEQFTI